jgi:hypothetical protein
MSLAHITGDMAVNEVSLLRLYLLRALYALVVVGLGVMVWPDIVHRTKPWELMEGVVACMLGAFSALCVLGLRYPLQMLPLLMWEFAWKALWLLVVALPLWRSGQMDGRTLVNFNAIVWGLAIPLVIPWRHVWARYLERPGDRWR